MNEAPATYSWEPTTAELAARTGLPRDRIVRFDTNTRPTPPSIAAEVLRGPFDPPLSEYPPSDYAPLVEAAADVFGVGTDELLPTAGADEALFLTACAAIREGGIAVAATPTYAMYRGVTEQRGGRFVGVPRLPREERFAIDVPAVRRAAREASLVWLCEPNNPTGTCETDERIRELLDGLAADAAEDRRRPPIVCLDEAYAEFGGRSLLPIRLEYPELVVVRTMSKGYCLAGIRVGFAVATPETLAPVLAFRAPASVSTMSAAVATAALRRPDLLAATMEEVARERERLSDGLVAAGWRPEPSVASFLLVRFRSSDHAAGVADALLERGLVARTYATPHPLADCLRLTVRSAAEDDRLIAAAKEIPA